MITTSKRFNALLSILLLAGVIYLYPTISNSEFLRCIADANQTTGPPGKISQKHERVSPGNAYCEETARPNHHKEIIETEEKASEFALEKDIPKNLRELLSKYYKGPMFEWEERAFKRVVRWKGDFENISKNYTNVDWKILSAIIKVETQGRTGKQVSSAKAVGMPQIKYQGAWAFVWDAMFSVKVKQGSIFVEDYYNSNIRAH